MENGNDAGVPRPRQNSTSKEIETLRYRLQKALRAAEKWKQKYEMEMEVNLELARRVEKWKKTCEDLKSNFIEKKLHLKAVEELKDEVKKVREELKQEQALTKKLQPELDHAPPTIPTLAPPGAPDPRFLVSGAAELETNETLTRRRSSFEHRRQASIDGKQMPSGGRSGLMRGNSYFSDLSDSDGWSDKEKYSHNEDDGQILPPHPRPAHLGRSSSVGHRKKGPSLSFGGDGSDKISRSLSNSASIDSSISTFYGNANSRESMSPTTPTLSTSLASPDGSVKKRRHKIPQNWQSIEKSTTSPGSPRPPDSMRSAGAGAFAQDAVGGTGTDEAVTAAPRLRMVPASQWHTGSDVSDGSSPRAPPRKDWQLRSSQSLDSIQQPDEVIGAEMQTDKHDDDDYALDFEEQENGDMYKENEKMFEQLLVVGVPDNWNLASLVKTELKAKKSKMSSFVEGFGNFMRRRSSRNLVSEDSQTLDSSVHSTASMAGSELGFDLYDSPDKCDPILHEVEEGARLQPQLIWHFPEERQLPSPDIPDFCFPEGIKVTPLEMTQSMSSVDEVVFGPGHTQRSKNSFVFLLSGSDQDAEDKMERMYGCCVVQPKVHSLKVVKRQQSIRSRTDSLRRESSDNSPKLPPPARGAYVPYPAPPSDEVSEDVQAAVQTCYCIISKLPFFDLHFRVLWDVLTCERLRHMQANMRVQEGKEGAEPLRHCDITDLSLAFLKEVAERYQKLQVPSPGGFVSFTVSPDLKPIRFERAWAAIWEAKDQKSVNETMELMKTTGGYEDLDSVADWSLTVLISWLPTRTLLWVVGALMCEMQLIVVSEDVGLLSACTLGLAALLRPLLWCGPLIPILPSKMYGYLDAPVPFLVGVPYLPEDYKLQETSVVLDLGSRTTQISEEDKPRASAFMLPGIDRLLKVLKPIVFKIQADPAKKLPLKPIYSPSMRQLDTTSIFQSIVREHIQDLCSKAHEYQNNHPADSDVPYGHLTKYLRIKDPTPEIFEPGKNGETEEEMKLEASSEWLRAEEDIFGFLQQMLSTQQFSLHEQLNVIETATEKDRMRHSTQLYQREVSNSESSFFDEMAQKLNDTTTSEDESEEHSSDFEDDSADDGETSSVTGTDYESNGESS